MKKLFILFMFSTCAFYSIYANEKPGNTAKLAMSTADSPQLKATTDLISGTVLDQSGNPVMGASILEVGSPRGTITDDKGNFKLTVTPQSQIMISCVGFSKQVFKADKLHNQRIVLAENTKILDKVVVIGYGSQKRIDLTSSISTIGQKDLANQTVPNALSAIQGKMAGVQITNSGSPGSSPSIRIRGTGSVYNSSPLYVVDGMMVNDISYLSPNDIANITVLRDASAAAIYGVRAANGVILVTTKSGTTGKTQVLFSAYAGIKTPSHLQPMLTTPEYVQLYNERMDLTGNPEQKIDASHFPASTNWFKEILSPSFTNSEDLNITGGTKTVSFSVGVNHLKEDGLVKDDNYDKIGIRSKIDFHINKHVSAGINMVVTSAKANPGPSNVLPWAYQAIPLFAPKDENGNLVDPTNINGFTPPGDKLRNPAVDEYYNHKWQNTINATGNAYVAVKFLKYLKFKSTLGLNPSFVRYVRYTPKYKVSSSQYEEHNNLVKNTNTGLNLSWDNTLTFTKSFHNDHNLTAMIGYTFRQESTDYINNTADDLVDIPEINQSYLFLNIGKGKQYAVQATDGGNKTVQIGYLGRVSYDYQHKYLFNFSMRADASSKFPANNRWGYFPSAGLGWVISREDFFKEIKPIDLLKLRVGWGELGNDNVPNNLYQETISNATPVIWGNDQNSGTGRVPNSMTVDKSFNPDLKWEVVNETNVGVDFSLLHDRLSGSVDWYYRLTQNAIFAKTELGSSGLNSSGVWGNYANILNTGTELVLDWSDKIAGLNDFSYHIGVNGSYNKNRVTHINSNGAAYFDQGDQTNGLTSFTRTREGQPVGEFFGYKAIGVFQNQDQIDHNPHLQNTKPGDLMFEDIDHNGVIDANDRTALGDPNPPITYGINLGFQYKNFDFNIFGQGVYGNKILNENRMLMFITQNFDGDFYKHHWTGAGSSNTYPSVHVTGGDPREVNSFYVESGSYFRIKTIQLGYTLPNEPLQKIGISKLRFYVNAENPFTFFRYNGFSPEVNSSNPLLSGVNNAVYPLSSVYSIGVNLNF